MLLELAIGDAYGAGFEYTGNVGPLDPARMRYVQHPRHRGTKPGMYTDDTQMSLALAELLVEGQSWTAQNLAAKFVDVFHRDPREGYASSFWGFLKRTKSGADFLANIRPYSDKSGAAMRAGPLGVLPDVRAVLDHAEIQAKVTHDTEAGIRAAQSAALMSHYFLYRLGPKSGLGTWIASHVAGDWGVAWCGKVGSKGWMSVRAAITAVERNDSLARLLADCIRFGGDVDTVATIALAAASGSEEYGDDLPGDLVEGLENGAYGREYLVGLDGRLMEVVRG